MYEKTLIFLRAHTLTGSTQHVSEKTHVSIISSVN